MTGPGTQGEPAAWRENDERRPSGGGRAYGGVGLRAGFGIPGIALVVLGVVGVALILAAYPWTVAVGAVCAVCSVTGLTWLLIARRRTRDDST
ncbi:hypothetical protein [Nocardia thraciensis]